MPETPYPQEFFTALRKGAQRSAREIVPLILELFQPQSVVDVGCGDGTWLAVFKEFGIQECLGIDGDYVQEFLQIPQAEFFPSDLKSPLPIQRTFDLVLSLEVAEHLPAESANIFVDSLTKLGETIVFSAAVPYQGGTEHINEQWPQYWLEFFHAQGYAVIDCIRDKIWNSDVEPWYAQNILVFVKQDCLQKYLHLERTNSAQLAIIHPKIYLQKIPLTKQLTPQSPPQQTRSGTLRINENRFGSMEIEITDVRLVPAEIERGDPLSIEIEYLSPQPRQTPLFSVVISKEQICLNINTTAVETAPFIHGQGSIKLFLERIDLCSGRYYVDVGIYKQDWTYAYDYHWHVYPLLVRGVASEGVLSPPHQWQIDKSLSTND